MSNTIKTGINWTKLFVALALMCSLFSFSPMAQENSNQLLDEESVAALFEELTDGLADLIEDEDQVTEITEKWNEREDLAGKTRTQILGLLFADVKSVVRDGKTQKNIQTKTPKMPVKEIINSMKLIEDNIGGVNYVNEKENQK